MKKNVSIGVLKSLSKELFRILKNKDLKEMDLPRSKDVLTSLEVLISMNKKSSQKNKSAPIIVNSSHRELGKLPIAYTDAGLWQKPHVWSLTDQGLREQVVMYGSIGSGSAECLISLGTELIKSGKGLVFLDGQGDMTLYTKFFGFCYENQIMDRLKFIKPSISDHEDRDYYLPPESHSINILSGMNQQQLCLWMQSVMQTWEESNPELFQKIPENILDVFNVLQWTAKKAIDLCQTDRFLTLNLLNYCFEEMSVQNLEIREEDLRSANINLSGSHQLVESQELKNSLVSVSLLWKEYLFPFVNGKSSLGKDYADVHLSASIKNKDVLIISKPYYDNKAFTNMIGVSLSLAAAHVEDKEKEDVQNVLIAQYYNFCFSPSLVRNLSQLRFSNIGIIWHRNTEGNQKSSFLVIPSTAIVMKWEELDLSGVDEQYRNKLLKNGIRLTKNLREGKCYVLSKNNRTEFSNNQDLRFEDPAVIEMKMPFTSFKTVDSSVFFAKLKKYENMEQLNRELNRNRSEELFEKKARILFMSCQYPGGRTKASLSWCQNTMAKIMGYSDWHHACQENKR